MNIIFSLSLLWWLVVIYFLILGRIKSFLWLFGWGHGFPVQCITVYNREKENTKFHMHTQIFPSLPIPNFWKKVKTIKEAGKDIYSIQHSHIHNFFAVLHGRFYFWESGLIHAWISHSAPTNPRMCFRCSRKEHSSHFFTRAKKTALEIHDGFQRLKGMQFKCGSIVRIFKESVFLT